MRFVFSILIIIIHINNSALFWRHLLDDDDLDYKHLLSE